MPYPELEYSQAQLEMLSQQINQTVLDVLKHIWNARKAGGATKAEFASMGQSRRKYDDAILILEAAQFIFSEEDGRSIRYYPSIRGRQLLYYIKEREEKMEELAEHKLEGAME
jgi:hypothetical protein